MSRRRIPDARRVVVRRGHDPPAIGAERRAQHTVGMAFQGGDLISRRRIPDARAVVERRGHDPSAIGAERRAPHLVGMALQAAALLSRRRIPDASATVERAVTIRWPSGLNEALEQRRYGLQARRSAFPEAASQMRALVVGKPVTIRGSSDQRRAPYNVGMASAGGDLICPAATPQTQAVLSKDAYDEPLPSGLKSRPVAQKAHWPFVL